MNRSVILMLALLASSAPGRSASSGAPDAHRIVVHLLSAPETRRPRGRARRLRVESPHNAAERSASAPVRSDRAEPYSTSYLGSVQLYAWKEGAIYRLHTVPEEISDIALQAGEVLISVAAGDSARWILGDTTSGSGTSRRAHVLVKPAASGLHTNLVIATDRRVYHLDLESGSGAGGSSLSWSYPDDTLLALRPEHPATPEPAVAAGVAVDGLDFDYWIEGDSVAWRPVRAFDDGRQVFIEFPADLGAIDAPPLFVIGDDGKAELVNYRLHGRYYIVDHLFRLAELRLGPKHQSVVRIRHGSRGPRRTS